MSSTFIRCERDAESPVGRIVFTRAGAGNAVSIEMVAAMRDGLAAFAQDDAIKVVLICAEGNDLTRGFDPAQVEQVYKEAPGGAAKKVPSQRARLTALDAPVVGA